MAAKRTAHGSSGKVYVDTDKNGDEAWFAEWRDHANRLIRKRIASKTEINSIRTARRHAAKIAGEVIAQHEAELAQKHEASTREMWAATQRASFPREVVAARVEQICERIAKTEFDEERRTGRPGMQLFSERTGISPRQVHRILEDETYIAVGTAIVDRICTQFEDLLDDFIASATDWAVQRGDWKDRPGTEDAWPFGYEADASGKPKKKRPSNKPAGQRTTQDWQREMRERQQEFEAIF